MSFKIVKDSPMPFEVTFSYIPEFIYTWRSKYSEMTKRNVSARLSEHVYRNLCLKGGKVFIYSVFWFMLNSAYKCNAFEIVNKQSILISPCYAETITIKRS